MSPMSDADRHDAPRLFDKLVPGEAAVVDDVVMRFEDPVRLTGLSPGHRGGSGIRLA